LLPFQPPFCRRSILVCEKASHAIFYGLVHRITVADLINNEWFKKGYKPPRFEAADVNLDDVNSIFNESSVSFCTITSHIVPHNAMHGHDKNLLLMQDPAQLIVERREEIPSVMNAFELISTSQGLNLGTLFEKQTV
jgi:hypothetical protein